MEPIRLTSFAHGGGCACKIPAGELEEAVRGLRDAGLNLAPAVTGTSETGETGTAAGPNSTVDPSAAATTTAPRAPVPAPQATLQATLPATPPTPAAEVLVGLDDGDDAAAVKIREDLAILSTTDFFTPVIDDAYDWGRIAAANALSDIYAMGGTPVVALNLVGWPREKLPTELLTEVLQGGRDVAAQAGCPVIGGHSIDDPEPKYGMAVTGTAHPERLLRIDTAQPGLPLTLTKPIGVGILNNRHKQTGENFPEAVDSMTTLNAPAAELALAAGVKAATDVTGFGLLGHLYKMCRASGVGAVLDAAAVPVLPAARESLNAGYVPGGSRRNLDWVRPHLDSAVSEDEEILLADAQTSGGLLVAGELPGHPVIGHLTEDPGIVIR